MSKSWMKKKPDRGIKIHPEYHLIISEGTDTEPAYFGTIKDIINKQVCGTLVFITFLFYAIGHS